MPQVEHSECLEVLTSLENPLPRRGGARRGGFPEQQPTLGCRSRIPLKSPLVQGGTGSSQTGAALGGMKNSLSKVTVAFIVHTSKLSLLHFLVSKLTISETKETLDYSLGLRYSPRK